ncbi:MAG: pentapeptide repeat-containing protein [Acidobacteriota bacterium]
MTTPNSKLTPKLKTQKPVPVLFKPIKVDFKDLFKALAKAIGHTAAGKWIELGADAVEALSALGLKTEPGELAFVLIRRSLTMAVFELVGDSASQFSDLLPADADSLVDSLNLTIEAQDMNIDQKFLDRPGELAIIESFKGLLSAWLKGFRIEKSSANAIAGRLPSYFVYALNQEWRRNSKSYGPLLEALNTPFTKAGDREWAWMQYAALLERRIQEPVFDEPFGLNQIFVPLSAYYVKERPRNEFETEALRPEKQQRRQVVIALHEELIRWLDGADPNDAIRVVSGGPGSGKSSFARVFAAKIQQTRPKTRVLFVPLHLIDASKDLVDEVGRFVRDEGVLLSNPMDPDSPEPNLLIVFDGLDELASQGKVAAETARGFVREVEKTVERRNQQTVRLRVLLSGRELVVQENESEFRRPRQILNLLPYFTPLSSKYENDVIVQDGTEYEDPARLLQRDARQEWWKSYGLLTGKGFGGLPKELSRTDLNEITAQPLLNYLVALSSTRDRLDFTKDINLNSIYADLVAAVHERGYEKHRAYGPIRHMTLDHFSRVLEEIGLAAWHGDGRTTSVREIEEHCKVSGVGAMLDAFQEGAKAGVTRLLAAFFFRQYGQRVGGDPTFVFTHKSFGEYLAARRVVRAMERVNRELDRRAASPDEGWDERDALKHWAQICGPSAMSEYLHTFLLNEVRLHSHAELEGWQHQITRLFNFVLRHEMPMEQLQPATFREAMFQSRNSEEALLVALNVCSQTIGRNSAIQQPEKTTFGTWLKRIEGQYVGMGTLTRGSLSFLNIPGANLFSNDLVGAKLVSSDLEGVIGNFSCVAFADLSNASLKGARFIQAVFYHTNLSKTNLEGAYLREAYLDSANLREANLEAAFLDQANLTGANLTGANLTGANLTGANLTGANLTGADLTGANLTDANLAGADLTGANLTGASLEGTNMKGATVDKRVTEQIRAFHAKQPKT